MHKYEYLNYEYNWKLRIQTKLRPLEQTDLHSASISRTDCIKQTTFTSRAARHASGRVVMRPYATSCILKRMPKQHQHVIYTYMHTCMLYSNITLNR